MGNRSYVLVGNFGNGNSVRLSRVKRSGDDTAGVGRLEEMEASFYFFRDAEEKEHSRLEEVIVRELPEGTS